MTGRRRETRFLMSPPWAGSLHTVQDVLVERVVKSDIWVLSSAPVSRSEDITLEMPRDGGTAELKVQVTDSRPVVVGDRVQHRVRLHLLELEQPPR